MHNICTIMKPKRARSCSPVRAVGRPSRSVFYLARAAFTRQDTPTEEPVLGRFDSSLAHQPNMVLKGKQSLYIGHLLHPHHDLAAGVTGFEQAIGVDGVVEIEHLGDAHRQLALGDQTHELGKVLTAGTHPDRLAAEL